MNAPRDVVFSIIDDLHRWSEWSPFERGDPTMKKTFEGPLSGEGASYAWNGNRAVGEGRMTITKSTPGELVSMKLEFTRPFKCSNQVIFNLKPAERGTRVRWIMEGKQNLLMKIMGLFVNMNKMIGKVFEQGLANLDRVAQAESAQSHSGQTAPAVS